MCHLQNWTISLGDQWLKVRSRSLLRATCRVVFFIRNPPQYALEVVHSSVRFRYKRPEKRVKNISPENNIYIYLLTFVYPHGPREPSEPSELKANRSARSTCHMSLSTCNMSARQRHNFVPVFWPRHAPAKTSCGGVGGILVPFGNVKIFCIVATRHPPHSTKLGLRSP